MRNPILAIAAVCVLGGPEASAQTEGGPPPANVRLEPVQMRLVQPRREVTGELRAVRQSTVASRAAGLVVALAVEAGDRVEAGAVLARLDDALAKAAADEARGRLEAQLAQVQAREAGFVKAQRDYDRLLAIGEAASEKELLDARSEVVIAEANLTAARATAAADRAALDRALQDLEDLTIVAPYAGVITDKMTEIGEWIGVGDAVVGILDLRTLDAWLNVPESLLAPLRSQGGSAQIRVRATGRVYEGAVSAVVPRADELTRLFPVRVRLTNEDGAMSPGMSIVGLIPTGERRRMLTLPKDAVLTRETGTFVYFDAGGVAQPATVQVRFAVGDRVVVDSDALGPGARVVVEGNERLFPGQPIAPAQPGPGAISERPAGPGGAG
ncbi:MAG: efflux RND transporter periplasmic adaptor subunit [Planctomycetota bacterium]|nr:MAG: efflux RND transporter periplasmic adaptor subunit [Planctomycetota bacterium]